MPNLLLIVALLFVIVLLVALRVVVRIRQARRMRSKPRPDHLSPAAPIMLSVIFVALFTLEAMNSTGSARAELLTLGAVSLVAALAGCFFANRDLHERAGDSWDVNRFTGDRVLSIACFAVAIVGLALSRIPSGMAGRYGWISPIATVVLLVLGNLVAWWWRRAHPTRGAETGQDPREVDGGRS